MGPTTTVAHDNLKWLLIWRVNVKYKKIYIYRKIKGWSLIAANAMNYCTSLAENTWAIESCYGPRWTWLASYLLTGTPTTINDGLFSSSFPFPFLFIYFEITKKPSTVLVTNDFIYLTWHVLLHVKNNDHKSLCKMIFWASKFCFSRPTMYVKQKII